VADPPTGRRIGVLGLDDTVALGLAKHLLARYLNAGLAAARPTKGRRKGEAYYATDTHILSVWDGTAWIEGGVGPTGPAGATGSAGPIGIGLDGADGVDGLPLPGPQGVPGAASTIPGPAGATIPGLDGTDGLDAFPIPGLPGLPGVSVMGPPGFDGEDGQEAFPIPGVAGAAGAAGVGTMGPPGMDGEDGKEGFPGPPGPAGTGGGGSGIALWDADADTGIQVEESADEDKIRFDTAGVERAVWDSTGFDIETHMAVGGAGTPSTAKILAVQEVLTATGTKSGIFVDVGYAGTHGSDALYGLNVTSRYQGTSPGTSAATYGLLFSVSYESAQTISNAVGVQGYLNSTAAGSGTWTAAAGLYVSGAYDGSKPATAYGLRIGSGTAPAGVVTFYGVRVEDSAATNPYLLDVGPTTRYFRVIGGAAPAANQTNVYINEGGTLRQVQWKNPDATGHLVATDKVLVLV